MAIVIPKNEMNEFSLPRVCVATGQQGAVTFQKTEFQYVPKWIAIFAFAPLLYLIFFFALRKTASGSLPFTEEAWANVKAARRNVALAAVGLVAGIFLSLFSISVLKDAGFVLFLVALVGGIAAIAVFSRKLQKAYPKVTLIDDRDVHLVFPSTQAEDMVRAHLSSGTRPVA
ncbi:MAG: hypothetical protein ACO1OB_30165 [Archangium sp.]